MSWAPHIKALPHAVGNSFIQAMQKMDVEFVITNPEGYDLNPDFEALKQYYRESFNTGVEYICQTTVPIAISCFLQTNDYESCVRLAISSGGDTDTVACMAGGIAAAFYGGIPQHIKEETEKRIPKVFKDILDLI